MGGKHTSTSDPKLNSISVQSSTLGLPLSIGAGRNRMKCNLIWYNAFTATPHTTEQSGGKGLGGGSSNTTYTYTASIMMALGEGPITGIRTVYRDKSVYTSLAAAGLSLATGTPGQAVWSYLTSLYPAQARAYSRISYVYASGYPLSDSATLANHSFEADWPIQMSGLADADPKDWLTAFFTNTQWGLPGWGSGLLGDWSEWSTYCRANNLLVSPLLESQVQASAHVTEITDITNSAAFWSEGLLKVRPYGDRAATGNGVTYTPNLTPCYDLTEDDFIEGDNAPVTVEIIDQSDAYNISQVEFLDRNSQYDVGIATAFDDANIDLYGPRKADPVTWHSICDAGIAQNAAQLLNQRSLYKRLQYSFTLPWNFILLEPMDLVTITTISDELNLNRQLVRILQIDESETDDTLAFVAEHVDIGTASAPTYAAHPSLGFSPNDSVAPGSVSAPFLFLAPANLAGLNAEIWLAAASTSATWGGCEVWISGDNVAYSRVGRVQGPARYGTLTAALPSHADPDTVNTLAVDLSTSLGTLSGTTASGMAAGATLAIVDGEVIAYQNATLTSANHYSLAPLARGQRGTAPAAHASGAKFARLDDAIFKFGYDQAVIGDTIYVKLPSFNIFGGALQDISTVATYTIAVPNAASRFQAALADITAITSDTILSRGEKPAANRDYQNALLDLAALDTRYTDLGAPTDLTTVKGDADTAVAALTTYLTGLSPSWTDATVDTPIVAATFLAKFTNVYTKLSVFRAAITGRTGSTQKAIYLRQLAPPSTPTGATPSGWGTTIPDGTATLWQSVGYFDAGGSLLGVWSTPRAISTNAPAGDYNSGTTYYLTNNVQFSGGTYFALQNNFSGHAPSGTASANAYWGVASAPGATGAPATAPGAFSPSPINLTSGAAINLRTLADAAGYTGYSNATITFNVPNGVIARGLSGGGIAIDTGSWPTGSYTIALTLVVQSGGIVDGGGGNGGSASYGPGGAGGDAIYCRVPLTITINSGGIVRGGGGGGASGSGETVSTGNVSYGDPFYGGGGGGGGAPNGLAGFGEQSDSAASGADGNAGTTSGGGTGGAGGHPTFGGGGGTNGANGGTFATAGGSSSTTGGPAGYAVRKNGNTVTVSNSGTMTGTAA